MGPVLLLTVVEILARVQGAYDNTRDFKASFKQVWANPAYAQTRTAYGYVYLKKPGQMRWNYVSPDEKMLVSDGKTLWVYEAEDGQIFKQNVRKAGLPAAVAFLAGGRKLSEDFDVQLEENSPHASPGRIVLRLLPKVPTAQYNHVLFILNQDDYLVHESIVVDHQGSENHLSFTGIKRNTRIPASKFKFEPPSGVPVINPRRVIRKK